jgi:predicted acetyltransferase
MTTMNDYGLPRDLGDGLTLRWATPDDAEAIANFNVAMQSDDPAEPETGLYYWVHDLMRGDHPTTKAGDFTVVVDADGRVVSSLCTISQTWTYDGIPFGVGRPELVATLPEYRRRGLVRLQMAIIHEVSAQRGELVTAITGIPWYYRQFGYEMTLNLGGSRLLFWARPGNDKKVESEAYHLRPATEEDIPVLSELYRAHLGQSPIIRPRDETLWRYEMFTIHPESMWSLKPHLVETVDGRVVAYVTWQPLKTAFGVREFGVLPGHSWRAVGHFVSRYLRQEAAILNATRPPDRQLSHISFILGEDHPIYEAFDRDIEKQVPAYSWYVRVPDVPAFLRHIAPALERRLAGSVLAGHTGELKLNFYRSRLVMHWDMGRLVDVVDGYEYDRLEDGDASFPEFTFLHLLFGHRSIDDLILAFTDVFTANNEARVLLRALFPQRGSRTHPLS